MFERGRIVAATAGQERGLSALARLCRTATEATSGGFVYADLTGPVETHIDLLALDAADVLGGLELLAEHAPSLSAIPRLRLTAASADEQNIDLDRVALAILMETREGKTVAELIQRHGLVRSLRALAALRGLDLIDFHTPKRHAKRAPVAVRGLVVLASLAVLARGLVLTFHIEGSSMEPTFNTGQRLAIERLAYVGNTPRRGEVVVFHSPTAPGEDFIKRVIAMPGDSILVQNGQVFVNDRPLDEPYVRFPADYVYPADGEPRTVPPDSYFVLGDNRPASFDSHSGWLVRSDELVGRAAVSIWPPSTWGPVRAPQAAV
jgi:signal peptidase I